MGSRGVCPAELGLPTVQVSPGPFGFSGACPDVLILFNRTHKGQISHVHEDKIFKHLNNNLIILNNKIIK